MTCPTTVWVRRSVTYTMPLPGKVFTRAPAEMMA
jgi:hypothetical protein